MSPPPANLPPPAAIILAAGKGTRMKGDLPKVVHPVGGRPMVCAVVDACIAAGAHPLIAVVGYKQELVREALSDYPQVGYAVQDQQLGTGHAVLCAQSEMARAIAGGLPCEDVLILAGDGPLIHAETLRRLLERHRASGAAATLATAVIDNPEGYGRITRDPAGRFTGIVEHKNATPAQRAIREVNPSYYCFRRHELFTVLHAVERNPASGEYYLTDVLALLLAQGKPVEVVPAVPPEDVLSINTPEDLATVDRLYRQRPPSRSSHAPAGGPR
jgi:UDP-N-acetylglucosamine diphosphorylase/glucosamine-1-phosphate N-acetyltransferase